MAERLRRCTRNPMRFPRAGSNPARSVLIYDQKLECVSSDYVATRIPLRTKIRSDGGVVAKYCSPGLVGSFVFSI